MANLERNNTQLNRKYDRRARIGAMVSGIPGVLGGGVGIAIAESSLAQPASAAIESHAIFESQSPAAFIKSVDSQVNDITTKMLASPAAKRLSHNALGGSSTMAGFDVYIVTAPGSMPHHYNLLIGSLSKHKETLPLTLMVLVNADSAKFGQIHDYQQIYQYEPANPDARTGTIELLENTGPGSATKRFRVGGVGDVLGPDPILNYSRQPSIVAGHYEDFLNKASGVLGLSTR